MRLTDERLLFEWGKIQADAGTYAPLSERLCIFARAVLALAALTDEPKEYQDRERRGFEVSTPGELL